MKVSGSSQAARGTVPGSARTMPAMHKITKKSAAVAAGVLVAFGGGAYAIGATTGSTKETPLTGNLTEKIRDAALAKVPGGSLVGVESEPGGTYEATVRKTNGAYVDVELNKALKVTGTHTGGRSGGRGHGRGHFMDTAALAKSLGVSQAKLEAALQKVRPTVRDERHADMAAALAKALGAKTADVQTVLDAQRGFGRGPGGGDDLVAALAKKTGKSQAAVRKALRSARPDRSEKRDELAAKLAKALGLSESKVQAALEKQRPDRGPGFGGPPPGAPYGPPPGAPSGP